MEYKILGLPFKREEFNISDTYRGICRNEIPESKFKEESKIDFLENLYVSLLSSDSKQMPVSDMLEITSVFTKLSTEPFELILIKSTLEDIPENILFDSLGYEVIASNESSMIHYWLRNKGGGFERLYETYIKKLNNNYLFSCVEDAQSFIKEIRQYTHIISSPSSNFKIDFEIVEIIQVKGISVDYI
ncbi:hypothetical protein [Pleomorphovibrio marinus]|uniref:hypothetical protein n=1 Tax=Pleomorphovibrio marinus TaxID=2164132 RepID=UPI000E0B7B75|nr:hypothetical protein [Pleomorphovibrio marinus]